MPWVFPAAVFVVGLHVTGTPARDIAAYVGYFALVIVLPGTLTFRALVGSRGNVPEDLGLGAATGLVVLLAGWALAAATGLQSLLPGWPLLIIAVFLAVPGLRRHWRTTDPQPLPLCWSWLVAAGLVVVVLIGLRFWATTPLPSVTASYYQDLLYHLALVHEMTRSMPFQVPQLAGDTLRYHYLADADMAAASVMTGVAPATVLLRLWVVPIAGVTVFVMAALGRELTGKWWAGALTGVTSVAATALTLGAATSGFAGSPISLLSPSQTYVLPLFGLLVFLAIQVLRGRLPRWGWFMPLPVAMACAGAKASVLPSFVVGMAFACLVVAWRDRARLRAALAFFAVSLVALFAGLKIFAGGGAGTLGVQPLALLYIVSPYRQTIGSQDRIDGTVFLLPGVRHASAAGTVFIVGLLVWWVLIHANQLLGLASLVDARRRHDPVVWLLTGITLAGTGAAWLLWHPSASQGYFYLGIIPVAVLLTVWFISERVHDWRPAVGGLVAGGIWAVVVSIVPPPTHPTLLGWIWALTLPILRTVGVAAVVGFGGLLLWRRIAGNRQIRIGRSGWRALGVAVLIAVLGAGLGAGVRDQVRGAVEALGKPRFSANPATKITSDEIRAARWLDQHAGANDIVATNIHCMKISDPTGCDARAFWVAGLGGRRTLVESWGYTDQVFPQDGVNGKRYYWQPAPYPERYALNERVFTAADPVDVAQLRNEYHVRWLFADRRVPRGVSDRLPAVATARFTAGPVTIYELP